MRGQSLGTWNKLIDISNCSLFIRKKISSKSHLKWTLKKLFIFEFKQLSKCCFLYFGKFLNFFGYLNRCNMLWPTYQTKWYILYFSWQSFIYICKYASLYKLIELQKRSILCTHFYDGHIDYCTRLSLDSCIIVDIKNIKKMVI